MAWGSVRSIFGTCGNIKFEFYDLTNVKSTQSLIKTGLDRVYFVSSTNTTDNKDILIGQTLNWSGTADVNTLNELEDSSEVFDPVLYNQIVDNTTDTDNARVAKKDNDNLYCYKPDRSAVKDLFPDGNEAWKIITERLVEVTASTADDNGTLIVMGG